MKETDDQIHQGQDNGSSLLRRDFQVGRQLIQRLMPRDGGDRLNGDALPVQGGKVASLP